MTLFSSCVYSFTMQLCDERTPTLSPFLFSVLV